MNSIGKKYFLALGIVVGNRSGIVGWHLASRGSMLFHSNLDKSRIHIPLRRDPQLDLLPPKDEHLILASDIRRSPLRVAGGMLERELVRESLGRAVEDRRVAKG